MPHAALLLLMLEAVTTDHHTTTVVAALAKHVRRLPEELRRSLTWDQGKEMHAHKRFTIATNVQVYFCDPAVPGSAAATKTLTA